MFKPLFTNSILDFIILHVVYLAHDQYDNYSHPNCHYAVLLKGSLVVNA